VTTKTLLKEKNTMGQENNSIEKRKGKHLTYEDRIKIEALNKAKIKASQIGKQLGRSRRTIERELEKGMVEQVSSEWVTYWLYSAYKGQRIHDERATNKGPGLKVGKDHKFATYVEKSVKEGNSPYATLQNITNNKLEFETKICVKTLYNYIDGGLFLGISNKDLLEKRNKKKRNYRKIRQAITNTKGTSIADRPEYIDDRNNIGHWEMDSVVGKQGTKTALLVLTERASRKELIFQIGSKSQAEVIGVLNRLEREMGRPKFSQIFKTITTDNGCEFLNFEGIEKSLYSKNKPRTKMYYAHPYSSWERGSNENLNKMIRRFIPKGADISAYSKQDIKRIETWMNNYPRKILGGISANMAEQNRIAS
jgi:transposase, IS30 family